VSIYQKLWQVMSEVDYIQKDKTNTFHRYNYASEAAIKEKLHESLVRNRVLFLPYKSELEERITGLGKDGKETLTTLKLYYKFVDIDSGEVHEGELHGVGSDALDKGIYKAITGCIKYILTGNFLIPTGDDPEREEEPKQDKKQVKAEAHAEQQAIAKAKIEQIQAGTMPESWDWRIALPRYESYEKRFGKEETLLALKTTGLNSIEDTRNQQHAIEVLNKVKARLEEPADTPGWVDKPHAKPESKLEKPTEALAAILERVAPSEPLNRKIAAIQNYKLYFREFVGEEEAARLYYEILDGISGHIETKAPMIAKDPNKVKECITRLQHELERMQQEAVAV
jgi:hypothetical protein